jgi:PmbA protein
MVELDASQMVKEALKMGVDDAIIQVVHEKIQQVRFSHNEITAAKEFNTKRAKIFVAKGKKKAQFTLENVRDIREDLKESVKFVDKMQENKDYYGIGKGPFEYRERKADRSIPEVNAVELASQAIEARTVKRVAGVLFTQYQIIDFASPYAEVEDERSFIELSVRAFEEGSSGHGVACSSTLKGFDGVRASEEASELAQKAKSPGLGKEGHYDLVFTPLCFATMLAGGLYSISAFFVDSGISFFLDKMGERVASDRFTLKNDGTLEKGIYASKFDEEGIPARRTSLIEDGILKSYLHNTSTAAKFETETTANAGLDIPEPQNLVVKEGNQGSNDLIGDVKNGLMVTNTWYTRFQNYMTGDFSTIPRDAILKIENGEIVGSVKNIRISDNMLRVLKNIDGLSNSTQQIHWWECEYPVFSPYVLVRDVNITTSTK